MTTIWHNPRCSKSRQTLKLLQERGLTLQIRRYLDNPPNREELESVLKMLGIAPRDLMRRREKAYKEQNLGDVNDDDSLIDAMVAHPRLIERPVVIHQGKAAIGRPPETVLELLS